jgi:hypothetical protein
MPRLCCILRKSVSLTPIVKETERSTEDGGDQAREIDP